MIFHRSSSTFVRRLPLLVCGLVLLLGARLAGAQIRTVLVSPVPGDSVASGTALRNALTGISSPSSTNRWLLKIEPGIYDIVTTPLQMRSWVDIEGSGIGVTTVRGSVDSSLNSDGTINGADNAELRLLTVEAQSNSSIAIANAVASPRFYRLRLIATAPNAWGIRNIGGSAPLIEECEIVVTSTGAANTFATGILFKGFTPAGIRSSILRSNIKVSGAVTNYGINILDQQAVTLIRDSRMDVVGGTTTYGISASPNSGWTGNESLQLRDSEISAYGGSSASYGINFSSGTTINLDVRDSKIWGHGSPTTYAIKQLGNAPMGFQGASLVGFTRTIDSASSVSIASTLLNGGPVTVWGWLGCMGVWDESGIFYANSCPP
jgi:hypothetical protein